MFKQRPRLGLSKVVGKVVDQVSTSGGMIGKKGYRFQFDLLLEQIFGLNGGEYRAQWSRGSKGVVSRRQILSAEVAYPQGCHFEGKLSIRSTLYRDEKKDTFDSKETELQIFEVKRNDTESIQEIHMGSVALDLADCVGVPSNTTTISLQFGERIVASATIVCTMLKAWEPSMPADDATSFGGGSSIHDLSDLGEDVVTLDVPELGAQSTKSFDFELSNRMSGNSQAKLNNDLDRQFQSTSRMNSDLPRMALQLGASGSELHKQPSRGTMFSGISKMLNVDRGATKEVVLDQLRLMIEENKELRFRAQAALADRDDLENRLRAVTSENGRLKQETERSETMLVDFQARSSAVSEENFNLRRKAQVETQRRARAQEDLDDARARVQELEKAVTTANEAERSKTLLDQKLRMAEDQMKRLEERAVLAEDGETELKAKLRDAEVLAARIERDSQKENLSLREELDKSKAEKERLQRLAQREVERGVGVQADLSKQTKVAQETEKKLNEKNAQVQKMTDTYKQLSEMYEELRAKYKTLGGERDSLKNKMSSDISDLQARSHADTAASKKEVADRLAAMDEVRKNREQELEKNRRERAEIEKELKATEQRHAAANAQLQKDLDYWRNEHATLQRSYDERLSAAAIGSANRVEEDIRQMVTRHNAQIEQLKVDHKREMDEMKEVQVADVKSSKSKFHKILKKMEKERDDAKEETSVQQIELSLKKTELANKDAQVDGVRREMEGLKIQLEQAEEGHRRASRQAEEVKDKLRTQKVEKAAATASLDMKNRELAFTSAERDRLRKEYDALAKQWRSKSTAEQTFQREKSHLQRELKESQAETVLLKEAVADITSKLSSAEAANVQLRQEKENAMNSSNRSVSRATEMEAELRMWEQNAQEAQAQLSSLQNELRKEHEKLRNLRVELDAVVVDRDGKSAEVAHMEEELERVNNEVHREREKSGGLASAKEEMALELERRTKTLQRDLDQASQELEDSKASVSKYMHLLVDKQTDELKLVEEAREREKNTREELEAKIALLTKEVDEKGESLTRTAAALEEMRSKADQKAVERERALRSTKEELASATEKSGEWEAKYQDAAQRLKAVEDANTETQRKLAAESERTINFATDRDASRQEVASLQQKMASLESDGAELRSKLRTTEDTKLQLQTIVDEKTREGDQLLVDVARLEEKIRRLQAEHEKSEEEVLELRAKSADLYEKASRGDEMSTELNNRAAALEDEVKSLKASLTEATEQREVIETELMNAISQRDRNTQLIERTCQERDLALDEVSVLKDEMMTSGTQLSSLTQENERRAQQAESLQRHATSLEAERKDLQEQLLSAKKELQSLNEVMTRDLQSSKRETEDKAQLSKVLSEEKSKLESEVNHLRDAVTLAEEEQAKLKKEADEARLTLSTTVNQLTQQLEEERSRAAALQVDVDKAEARVAGVTSSSAIEIQALKTSLEESNNRTKTLSNERDALQNEIDASRRQRAHDEAAFTATTTRLQTELDTLNAQNLSNAEERGELTASLSAVRREKDKVVFDLDAERDRMRSDRELSQLEVERLTAALTASEEKRKAEQVRIASALDETETTLNEKTTELQNTITKLRSLERSSAEALRNAEDSAQIASEDSQKLRLELDSVSKREADLRASCNKLESQESELRAKLRDIEFALEHERNKSTSLLEQLDTISEKEKTEKLQLTRELEKERRDLETARREVTAMQAETEERRREAGNSVPVSELERMRAELAEAREAEEAISGLHEADIVNLQSMQQKYNSLRRKTDHLVPAEDYQALKRSAESAVSKCAKLEKLELQARDELQQLQGERDELLNELINTKLELANVEDNRLQQQQSLTRR